jgi:hypothetical protein
MARVRACALVAGGILHAYAYPSIALAVVEPGDFAFAAIGASAGLRIPLARPFTLEPAIAPLVLLTPRQALVRGQVEPAYEQSTVALVASVGIGIHP